MRSFFLAILLLSCLSSCVTNKKFTILQKDDLHRNQVKDSVLRTYMPIPYDYRLQPYDIVTIRFESLTPSEFDFLNKQAAAVMITNPAVAAFAGEMIDNKGEIYFPVIGAIKVTGLTLFEMQAKLQKLADEFLDSPKVIARLVNFRVTLLGEVAREGQVNIMNHRTTMLEVLGLGGGLGEYADRANIKVIRQSETGQVSVAYVNVLDENFINSPYFYAHQGDVLVVPPLRQKPFRRYFGSNLALVSSSIGFLLLAYNIFNQN